MSVDLLKFQQLDKGEAVLKLREHWWQVWHPKNPPPPAPSSLDSATVTPLHNASFWSIMTYSWVTPLLVLGYQRPLQATDLWKMDPDREVACLTEKLDTCWAKRVEAAEQWNIKVASGEITPNFIRKSIWAVKSLKGIPTSGWNKSYDAYFKKWGHREASLAWALNDTLGWQFWLSGAAKVIGDTAQLMGPLLVKAIINFGKIHFAATTTGQPAPSPGPGIAMAIGLFCVTVVSVTMQQQFFWRSMSTGVLARGALIASIYKRGVFLAPSSRPSLPISTFVNHISTDISRLDDCAQWFHAFWTAPVQVTVCLIILLAQLGPSTLAGFCLFLIITPIQQRAMTYQFRVRQKSMFWTDLRARLVQELLGGMRVVKWFTYEQPLLQRVRTLRKNELRGIWKILLIRAANQSVAYSIPALAAILAFVTYSLAGNGLDPAVIFSSLSLFQLLRQPLMFLPRSLSSIADAQSALLRLRNVFTAGQMEKTSFIVDPNLDVALRVKGASFQWEESRPPETQSKGNKKSKKIEHRSQRQESPKQHEPFVIKNLDLEIPWGELCAIVGPVGSGKTSLLLGLIGEMRRTAGSCTFGGSVSYCSQTAWIQNATLRDNILFGQRFEEERYWKVVQDACLLPDLEILPNKDLTEIGEKGINLSGGQRQRVNIARALYRNAEIVIFDDPLSAVDAHVGKALFVNVILNTLKQQGKTVVLVTHALHFLHQVDFIYTIVNGRIAEKGTYEGLTKNAGAFSKLVTEFAGAQIEDENQPVPLNGTLSPLKVITKTSTMEESLMPKTEENPSTGRLMKAEKRTVGSVPLKVYLTYLKAGQGIWTVPLILLSAALMQASSILNTYALVWWQNDSFHQNQTFYMSLYGCLGVLQAIFTFALGTAMSGLSIFASQTLYWKVMQQILYAPMAMFDTTPLGRLLSVLGKDIDVLDNQLSVSVRMFIVTISNVFGAVLIVTILTHYFIIAAAVLFLGYVYFVSYYRNSARELKRLDANLRSLLYSHFSESLSGLPTIRAYGEIPRFLSENHYYIDLQSRALYPIVTSQRWLAVRLGFLGSILVFTVGLLAVIGVNGLSPAQIGLALTYTTSLTQSLNMVTRQSAEVENYMNSVERVVHYSSDAIEQEAPHEKDDPKPPKNWPLKGSITFKNVFMNYRPGLPAVLKGISLNIRPREKIGVVGRTGAGKSSLTMALFRLVELASGSIFIDDIDISTLGLRDVRSKIAIIPQEPLLFSGTIRSNLDPFSTYDDAHLWDALRRAHLVEISDIGKDNNEEESISSGSNTPTMRFHLDTIIESEGANLSVGERSLLSLARALVKEARVIVLDEATASVDLETDAKVQATIKDEFKDKTLICIAHRLRTILSYDRILVMDNGAIAEFGSPLELFEREKGIFYNMCVQSNITRTDLEKSQIEN